jgi:hypothetical protein
MVDMKVREIVSTVRNSLNRGNRFYNLAKGHT